MTARFYKTERQLPKEADWAGHIDDIPLIFIGDIYGITLGRPWIAIKRYKNPNIIPLSPLEKVVMGILSDWTRGNTPIHCSTLSLYVNIMRQKGIKIASMKNPNGLGKLYILEEKIKI